MGGERGRARVGQPRTTYRRAGPPPRPRLCSVRMERKALRSLLWVSPPRAEDPHKEREGAFLRGPSAPPPLRSSSGPRGPRLRVSALVGAKPGRHFSFRENLAFYPVNTH